MVLAGQRYSVDETKTWLIRTEKMWDITAHYGKDNFLILWILSPMIRLVNNIHPTEDS